MRAVRAAAVRGGHAQMGRNHGPRAPPAGVEVAHGKGRQQALLAVVAPVFLPELLDRAHVCLRRGDGRDADADGRCRLLGGGAARPRQAVPNDGRNKAGRAHRERNPTGEARHSEASGRLREPNRVREKPSIGGEGSPGGEVRAPGEANGARRPRRDAAPRYHVNTTQRNVLRDSGRNSRVPRGSGCLPAVPVSAYRFGCPRSAGVGPRLASINPAASPREAGQDAGITPCCPTRRFIRSRACSACYAGARAAVRCSSRLECALVADASHRCRDATERPSLWLHAPPNEASGGAAARL